MQLRTWVVLTAVVCVVACGDDPVNELPDDLDGDGIADVSDNCVGTPNVDQLDTDKDRQGNACDLDDDNDGVRDADDNCALVANPDQADGDEDAAGDACDDDADGDGIANAADNCPLAANQDQLNLDGDALGDACDPDDDDDGALDADDNCPRDANDDQLDSDEDALGDACDGDDDNDGRDDADDNCPTVQNPEQPDLDADGLGDDCDPDDDADGVADAADNCPRDANEDQANADGDELGNACDNDDDNDEIGDEGDNCPVDANGDQADLDGDGQGDVCDGDRDGDGLANDADNCASVFNADQADGDEDGTGDACDNCPVDGNRGQEDGDGDGAGDVCDNCLEIGNDQTDSDGDGIGDACEVLEPTASGALRGGNIASVGAGFAGRFTGQARPQLDLVLAGVPQGAAIQQAFLYWTVIGAPFETLTLDGAPVTGTEIGRTGDTCWNIGQNIMYRADVTARVPGNGTYKLTDLRSTTNRTPDGQGVSLVVVYANREDPRFNFITINDGAVGFVSGSEVSRSIARGFEVPDSFDKVTAINLVADGQPAGDELSFQGQPFGNGDAFQGLDGAMWDNRVDDITGVITPGTTEIATEMRGQGDCLAWSMSAIVVEDVGATIPQFRAAPRPARAQAKARPVPATVAKARAAHPLDPFPLLRANGVATRR